MSKIYFVAFFLIYIILFSSCVTVTPENLNYDSAKMLDKGTVELQGNFGLYPTYDQMNIGSKVGVGISKKYNIKLRYETMSDINNSYGDKRINWYFIELENKIRIADFCALSLPFGWYNSTYLIDHWFEFKPAIFFTTTFSKKVDFSLIPKGHFLFYSGENLNYFGVSLGAGFSTNLDNWAIRPEFGWDQIANISCGIGFSYNFKVKKEN